MDSRPRLLLPQGLRLALLQVVPVQFCGRLHGAASAAAVLRLVDADFNLRASALLR